MPSTTVAPRQHLAHERRLRPEVLGRDSSALGHRRQLRPRDLRVDRQYLRERREPAVAAGHDVLAPDDAARAARCAARPARDARCSCWWSRARPGSAPCPRGCRCPRRRPTRARGAGSPPSNRKPCGRAADHDVDDSTPAVDVVVVRALVVAPAHVHPHALGRDVARRVVQRLDVAGDGAAELVDASGPAPPRPASRPRGRGSRSGGRSRRGGSRRTPPSSRRRARRCTRRRSRSSWLGMNSAMTPGDAAVMNTSVTAAPSVAALQVGDVALDLRVVAVRDRPGARRVAHRARRSRGTAGRSTRGTRSASGSDTVGDGMLSKPVSRSVT